MTNNYVGEERRRNYPDISVRLMEIEKQLSKMNGFIPDTKELMKSVTNKLNDLPCKTHAEQIKSINRVWWTLGLIVTILMGVIFKVIK